VNIKQTNQNKGDVVNKNVHEINADGPYAPTAKMTPDCPFEPRLNMVIIKRFDKPEKVGMLHRPQNQQVPMDTGKVIGIGPGHWDDHGHFISITQLELGDIVNFISNAGRDVEDGDSTQSYYHIPAANIISRRRKDLVDGNNVPL